MKKVRFETPDKNIQETTMRDLDCHSPRPFYEKKFITPNPDINYGCAQIVQFSTDPVQQYENGNSSPYPTINKTCFLTEWKPSNELEISMLDSFHQTQKNITNQDSVGSKQSTETTQSEPNENCITKQCMFNSNPQILSTLENRPICTANVKMNDDFFIRRNNLCALSEQNHDILQINNSLRLGKDKENSPLATKFELMKMSFKSPISTTKEKVESVTFGASDKNTDYCQCHHCIKILSNVSAKLQPTIPTIQRGNVCNAYSTNSFSHRCNQLCSKQLCKNCSHCEYNTPVVCKCCENCFCNNKKTTLYVDNSVDKKKWVIERYESKEDGLEVKKQGNVKEKREPTVSDLFKIIKLQNEQLQLLQEKVDKFISASKNEQEQKRALPLPNYLTEQVSVESVDKESHKISIGVMTSFEMVRTSTIINKEIVKQSEAQIQCNRSQISIKEVVSKSHPVNLNFLDGIMPNAQNKSEISKNKSIIKDKKLTEPSEALEGQQEPNVIDEKTLNELSLYNVQIDNATTPLMSPEQTMYLDVRDYSDSESENDDQSNVGWTYYNKVMTHVNGMLHDSDMPSSASALYRNTRQKCMQMQIDKTNVSVIKRVKFGDDPVGVQRPYVLPASTDTSLKMNQLAAKYLKHIPVSSHQQSPKPVMTHNDMSFATRNYMEKHKLLQGIPQEAHMPKFLDITALKQQPKLL